MTKLIRPMNTPLYNALRIFIDDQNHELKIKYYLVAHLCYECGIFNFDQEETIEDFYSYNIGIIIFNVYGKDKLNFLSGAVAEEVILFLMDFCLHLREYYCDFRLDHCLLTSREWVDLTGIAAGMNYCKEERGLKFIKEKSILNRFFKAAGEDRRPRNKVNKIILDARRAGIRYGRDNFDNDFEFQG